MSCCLPQAGAVLRGMREVLSNMFQTEFAYLCESFPNVAFPTLFVAAVPLTTIAMSSLGFELSRFTTV
jgi:hypothetical protein